MPDRPPTAAPRAPAQAPSAAPSQPPSAPPVNPSPGAGTLDEVKDRFLSIIQQVRLPFYRTVVAQAQRIDIIGDRIIFSFSPVHRMLKEQVEQNKAWLESQAEQAAGRHLAVQSQFGPASGAQETSASKGATPEQPRRQERDLRGAVLADDTVQALLGIFPAEIRSVEEIDPRGERKP